MPGKRAASRGSGSRKRPTRRSPPPARPIPGPDAFSNLREPGYLQSQAATLLLIGSHLRGDAAATRARAVAASGSLALSTTATVEALPAEDVQALGNRDLLTRDVAAHALARLDPGNPRLAKLLEPRTRRSTRKRSRTSLIVHGTWARASSWWQPPSGDFWKYLHDTVDGTLYGAADRFEWSGGYSDLARALAGSDLQVWVQQHQLAGLDLFTHSHGG